MHDSLLRIGLTRINSFVAYKKKEQLGDPLHLEILYSIVHIGSLQYRACVTNDYRTVESILTVASLQRETVTRPR